MVGVQGTGLSHHTPVLDCRALYVIKFMQEITLAEVGNTAALCFV